MVLVSTVLMVKYKEKFTQATHLLYQRRKWTILNFSKTVPIPVNVLRVQSTKYQMRLVDVLTVQPCKS